MTPGHSLVEPDDLSEYSDDGLADIELSEQLLQELECLEHITSCDRVDNYVMLSEYEQNLIKETEEPVIKQDSTKKGRKWSLVRQNSTILKGKVNLITA